MHCLKTLSFLIVAACLFASGCSSNNKGKIEGTRWRSDEVKEGKRVTSPLGARQLEFRADGTMNYTDAGKESFGTYSLGSGNSVTFTLKKEVGGSKSPAKKIIIDGDKLTLIKTDDTDETYSKAGIIE